MKKNTTGPRRGKAGQRASDKGAPAAPAAISLKAVEGAIGYHLRRAQTFVLDDIGRRMEILGLNPRDFTVMLVISANPGINATRIADSLPMKASNLSVLLLKLKRRGLVRRAAGEEFGRIHSLHLTRDGMAILEQARRLHFEHLRFIESLLGRLEMARLIRLLRKLGSHAGESG